MSALARKYSLQGSWKGSSQSSSSVSCQSSSPRMLLSSRALVDSLGCSVGGGAGQRTRYFVLRCRRRPCVAVGSRRPESVFGRCGSRRLSLVSARWPRRSVTAALAALPVQCSAARLG